MAEPTSIGIPRLIALWMALGLCVTGRPQTAAAPSAQADPAPIAAPIPTTPTTSAGETPAPRKRGRAMSDELAAVLASTMPKYLPAAQRTETDQPRNGIIRMPRYFVKEPRPPVFTERQIHTRKGLAAIAMKRQRGLAMGNFLGMNGAVALMMYDEQERLDNLADMADAAQNARNAGDSAGADYLMRERFRTAYRPSPMGGNRLK